MILAPNKLINICIHVDWQILLPIMFYVMERRRYIQQQTVIFYNTCNELKSAHFRMSNHFNRKSEIKFLKNHISKIDDLCADLSNNNVGSIHTFLFIYCANKVFCSVDAQKTVLMNYVFSKNSKKWLAENKEQLEYYYPSSKCLKQSTPFQKELYDSYTHFEKKYNLFIFLYGFHLHKLFPIICKMQIYVAECIKLWKRLL